MTVRVDAWTWGVRVFKTRTAAAAACRAGHVRVNGERAKPATPVGVGDRVVVRQDGFDRDLEVRGLLTKRAAAPVAEAAYVDHTPPRPPREAVPFVPVRDRGAGRPTKRERRDIDRLRGRGAAGVGSRPEAAALSRPRGRAGGWSGRASGPPRW